MQVPGHLHVLCPRCPSTATPKVSPPPGLGAINRLSELALCIRWRDPPVQPANAPGRPLGVGPATNRAPFPGQLLGACGGHGSPASAGRCPQVFPGTGERPGSDSYPKVASASPQPGLSLSPCPKDRRRNSAPAAASGAWSPLGSRKGAFRPTEVPAGEAEVVRLTCPGLLSRSPGGPTFGGRASRALRALQSWAGLPTGES